MPVLLPQENWISQSSCMQLQRGAAVRLTTVDTASQPRNQWMKHLEQTCWRLTKIYEPTKLHAPLILDNALEALSQSRNECFFLTIFRGLGRKPSAFLKIFFRGLNRCMTVPRELYSSTSSSIFSLPGGTASACSTAVFYREVLAI